MLNDFARKLEKLRLASLDNVAISSKKKGETELDTTERNDQNIFILRYKDKDGTGTPSCYAYGKGIRLFIVFDYNEPNDRVKEVITRDTEEIISSIIPDGSFVTNEKGKTYRFHLNDILK